jgi:hypothetical protein
MARQLMHCAADLLAIRAGLEEVRLDLRKASRHYRAATRCLTGTDIASRWQLLTLQAQALLRLDQLAHDDAVFGEAVRALVEAVQLDIRQIGSQPMAMLHRRLLELLVELGHRTNQPQAFVEAARHGSIAADLLKDLGATGEIGDVQYDAARALWLAAEGSGDLAMVDAAARTFRDVLEGLHRERDPERWVAATSYMGQTLLRMATLRAEPTLLPVAIEHLRAAVQFASTCNVAIDTMATETALGRALLAEFAAGGQPLLLDLAATAFRRAIKSAAANGQIETKGGLQHELGMTLWAMAERAGQTSGLTTAAETLQASIATYEGIAATPHAAVVRADLAKLNEIMAGGTAPPAPGTSRQYH